MKVKKTNNNKSNAAGAAPRQIQPRGKPDNYWELCQALQAQDDTDFEDLEPELQSLQSLAPSVADEENELEHRAEVATKAIERERQSCGPAELLLGEKEMPGVLRTLARVYDFQNCRLLDKPREPAVKPLAAVTQPQSSRLREVPVVPPELDTLMVEQQQQQQQQQQQRHFTTYPQQHSMPPQQYPPQYPHHPAPHYPPPFQGLLPPPTNFRCLPAPVGFMPRFNRPPLKQRPPPHVPPHRQHSHRQPLYAPPQRQPTQVQPASVLRAGTRKPIIVVPAEFSSLVTLHNVQPLLQEQRFVPPAIMRRSDLRLLEEVGVVRNFRGEEQHYRVIDNVARLTTEDWDQVVAVFVFNPHQQFIGWPSHADPAAICRQLCAFHLTYKGKPIYRELESLWLNVLSISEQDRTLDGEILMEFWRKLDQHMAKSDRQLGIAWPK